MAVLPRDIFLADEDATIRLGQDLALAIRPGDCLALHGDLGAGKSTLARALIRCVADDSALDVPSPTFTLVQTYDLRLTLSHFDLYRIADPQELSELGLDEALADGAVLMEWPEHAGDEVPSDAVHISIGEEADGRRVEIEGPSEALERIARSFRIRTFLDGAGRRNAQRRFLLGDASARIYETILSSGRKPELLMNAPRREIGPVLRDGKRYAQIAHTAEDIAPFIAIDHLLDKMGFRVPAVLAHDLKDGLALIEHLGEDRILDDKDHPITDRWETAIDCLVALHRQDIPATVPVPDGGFHTIPPFDADAMMVEAELFLDWYIPFVRGSAATPVERASFETTWNDLIETVAKAEAGLVLRDFHSPNIVWQNHETGVRKIGLIDFQDAMIGPLAYDVASLVHDARVTIRPDFADHLVRRYESARSGLDENFDPERFRSALAIMQAQRATKILGIFIRLRDRDGKPGYLRHLPRMESYLRQALKHPVLHPLQECYTKVGITLNESERS
ncbi:MAG: tRNA (adenosine(37)-N6)-threonylcarbamoyltransferase complex ATPase subunit type 1 TsaE [Alphaproteobacteria bacterium]|nr:tRNA (adenosine(37)-N6)-threonylcarbamoyltransferase complex ATPase subunit type 1 TsaE [Alphaproteobacteria bacterium]